MVRRYFLTLLVGLLATAASFAQESASPSARDIVAGMRAIWKNVSDYQCRIYEWGTGHGKSERRAADYYYAQPGRIRIDVIEGNQIFDAGSVLVFTGGDKVDGHKGGLLSWTILRLDKHDPLVSTTRGMSVDQTTIGALISWLELGISRGRTSVQVYPGSVWLTIDRIDPIVNDGVDREVLAFEPRTYLPVYSASYAGTTQVQFTRWTEYRLNTGLPERLFSAKLSRREAASESSVRLGELAVNPSGWDDPPRR
jgi:hypothetical protein